MYVAWLWRYDTGGSSSTFPTQAEAEAWLGEAWAELREQGVAAVTLCEGEREVYGPMSLDPA